MFPIYSGRLLSSGSSSQSTWSLLVLSLNAPSTKGIPDGKVILYSLSPHKGTDEQAERNKTETKRSIFILITLLKVCFD